MEIAGIDERNLTAYKMQFILTSDILYSNFITIAFVAEYMWIDKNEDPRSKWHWFLDGESLCGHVEKDVEDSETSRKVSQMSEQEAHEMIEHGICQTCVENMSTKTMLNVMEGMADRYVEHE